MGELNLFQNIAKVLGIDRFAKQENERAIIEELQEIRAAVERWATTPPGEYLNETGRPLLPTQTVVPLGESEENCLISTKTTWGDEMFFRPDNEEVIFKGDLDKPLDATRKETWDFLTGADAVLYPTEKLRAGGYIVLLLPRFGAVYKRVVPPEDREAVYGPGDEIYKYMKLGLEGYDITVVKIGEDNKLYKLTSDSERYYRENHEEGADPENGIPPAQRPLPAPELEIIDLKDNPESVPIWMGGLARRSTEIRSSSDEDTLRKYQKLTEMFVRQTVAYGMIVGKPDVGKKRGDVALKKLVPAEVDVKI
jgi:hypothetical protein